MKVIRKIIMVLISLAFSAGMFYCFQAGAPAQDDKALGYTIVSALFSLLMPAALTASYAYIRYLQEKLEEEMRK